MANNYPTDYGFNAGDAIALSALPIVNHAERVRLLEMCFKAKGKKRFIELFADFVGLANETLLNAREMSEMVLITECNMYPQQAEKINMPDLFGALQGIALAHGIDQSKLCDGCAFRRGTTANQSSITTTDAFEQIENSDPFLCHIDDDGGFAENPRKACRGWSQAVNKVNKPIKEPVHG